MVCKMDAVQDLSDGQKRGQMATSRWIAWDFRWDFYDLRASNGQGSQKIHWRMRNDVRFRWFTWLCHIKKSWETSRNKWLLQKCHFGMPYFKYLGLHQCATQNVPQTGSYLRKSIVSSQVYRAIASPSSFTRSTYIFIYCLFSRSLSPKLWFVRGVIPNMTRLYIQSRNYILHI